MWKQTVRKVAQPRRRSTGLWRAFGLLLTILLAACLLVLAGWALLGRP